MLGCTYGPVVGMVDAIAAYKEAFASYRKNTVEYAKYSFLMGTLATFLSIALVLVFFVLGMLASGSAASISVMVSALSLNLVGLAAIFLVIAVGMLVFIWAEMGITGAYVETVNMILSGRKQTVPGFISAIPRRATTLTLIAAINTIIVILPILLFAVLGLTLAGGDFNSIVFLGMFLAGIAVSMFLLQFLAFGMVASVVDGRGPIDSVRRSFATGAKNVVPLIIYYVIGGFLMLPVLFPGIGALYAVLFAGPLLNGALITMYKKSK